MENLIEYQVKFTRSDQREPCTTIVYAQNRADAVKTVLSIYRGKKPKIKTAHKSRVLLKPEPKPAPLPEPAELGFQKMLERAKKEVSVNALSGRAIGNYLKLLVLSEPTHAELGFGVNWVIRQVENKITT